MYKVFCRLWSKFNNNNNNYDHNTCTYSMDILYIIGI